jgi:hypothetical protein
VVFPPNKHTNKNRQTSANPIDRRNDYVGHYRLGENGDKGKIAVVRSGDKLFETWPDEKPVEILPG